MKRRSAVAWSVVVALTLSLIAGCGSNSATTAPASSQSSGSAKQPVTIVWSFWGDPWEVALDNKVKDAFEAENPDINIETQVTPWSNYFDKLQVEWAGGNSPDVMFLTNIPAYANKGVLMDLNPLIRKDQFDLSQYPAAMLDGWKSDDGTKFWGAPRDNDTKVIYYNKTLFDQAGLPYPKQGWTWDDLRKDAIALTKRENGVTTQYGFAFETAFWRLWLWQNGGHLFDNNRNPSKSTINSPESVRAVQFLSDLINKDKVTPPYDQLKSSSNIGALFSNGKLGMAWGNAPLIPNFSKITDFRWDVAPMPVAAKDKPFVAYVGGAGYTISSRTKHPDAAFKFWSFLAGPEAQGIFASSGLIVPATKAGMQSDAFARNKPYDVDSFIYDTTQPGRGNPSWIYWPQASKVLDTEIQKALVGQESAADAVKGADSAITSYIKNPH